MSMTLKERHEARKAMITAKILEASHKGGYGVGYAIATVKNEIEYAASKVASTEVARKARIGYYDGKSDANYDFARRCAKREQKARERADAKAAEAAAEELMDEFDEFDN